MHFKLVLKKNAAAATNVVIHDPAYLEFLKSRNLPPPEPYKVAGNPYVAEIRGYHATYGLDRRFASYSQPDEFTYEWWLHPAVYEIQKHAFVQPKRGFVVLDPQGKFHPMTMAHVLEWLDQLPGRHLDTGAEAAGFHR